MRGGAEHQQAIQELAQRIVRTYAPERIVLFGSYAYGTPHEDSDVDLLIIKSTDEPPLQRRVAVRRLIYDTAQRLPVGLIVVTPDELRAHLDQGDQFFEEIAGRGEVLYDR